MWGCLAPLRCGVVLEVAVFEKNFFLLNDVSLHQLFYDCERKVILDAGIDECAPISHLSFTLLLSGVRRGITSWVNSPGVWRGADADGKPPPVFPHWSPPLGWGESVAIQHLCQPPGPQRDAERPLLPALTLESRRIVQNAVCYIVTDRLEGAAWVYSEFTWVGSLFAMSLQIVLKGLIEYIYSEFMRVGSLFATSL